MKLAQGLEHQWSRKFPYVKGTRWFTGAQKTGVTDRKDKGGITRNKVDIDFAEVIKINRQVLQMKRQLKKMYWSARNIKGT